MNRRDALVSAGCAAVALPAHALAATGADVDPGLAQLEAGYRELRGLWAKVDSVYAKEDAAFARASGRRKQSAPAPVSPPELDPVMEVMSGSLEQVLDPNHPLTLPPDLLAMYREYDRAWMLGWKAGRRWPGPPQMSGGGFVADARGCSGKPATCAASCSRSRRTLRAA